MNYSLVGERMANQMQGDGAVNPVINGEENTNAKSWYTNRCSISDVCYHEI